MKPFAALARHSPPASSRPPPPRRTPSCGSTGPTGLHLRRLHLAQQPHARVSGGDFELRDPTVDGGSDPGPCRPGDVTDDANAYIVQVFCRRAGIERVRVDLGEREDSATVALPVPITLLGGPGADRLTAGPAAASTAGTATTACAAAPERTCSTAAPARTTSTAARATTAC